MSTGFRNQLPIVSFIILHDEEYFDIREVPGNWAEPRYHIRRIALILLHAVIISFAFEEQHLRKEKSDPFGPF
ncbi:hypothetical protein KIN20_001105 [Parelaphostrongylus tenuis]|uniref:Uncharacterized protein n=1 Tax=Parelaphostrongylus tenuis TaxID=148309 RepID=A0AAD5MC46_PARTN|nr:hypothetical protein KIN20_001105 [Parelaphostrongylus tenuis]